VDRVQQIVGLALRLDEGGPGHLELSANRLRALRQLGPGNAHSDPDLAARIVLAVQIAPDDWQRESHPTSLIAPG
jgi:hypothetical protein